MKKAKLKKPGKFSRFCSKFLVCIVLMLGLLIVLKGNPTLKKNVYDKIFSENINFSKITDLYEKYLGSIFPLDIKDSDTQTVSSKKIDYTKAEAYKDGVSLTVSKNYAAGILKSGIVTFAGEKEGYGNTVVILQADDTEVWYGNLSNIEVSMYDYLKAGDIVGQTLDDKLYMAFMKDGKVLDYKDYI